MTRCNPAWSKLEPPLPGITTENRRPINNAENRKHQPGERSGYCHAKQGTTIGQERLDFDKRPKGVQRETAPRRRTIYAL
jgi:hypothetical protein